MTPIRTQSMNLMVVFFMVVPLVLTIDIKRMSSWITKPWWKCINRPCNELHTFSTRGIMWLWCGNAHGNNWNNRTWTFYPFWRNSTSPIVFNQEMPFLGVVPMQFNCIIRCNPVNKSSMWITHPCIPLSTKTVSTQWDTNLFWIGPVQDTTTAWTVPSGITLSM